MSMKAKDYLYLPERIDNIVEIQMPPEIQKAYDSFEEEQVLKMCIRDRYMDAETLARKITRYGFKQF